MKPFLTTLLLAFSLFTFFSCRKSNPVNPVDASTIKQLWPIQVGNTWVMQYTELDTSGNILYSSYDTLIVTRDTIIFISKLIDSTFYEVSGSFGSLRTPDSFSPFGGLMAPSRNGSFVVLTYTVLTNGFMASTYGYYVYPAGVGDYNTGSPGPRRTQSIDTTIAVPQGTHSCYEYEYFHGDPSNGVVTRKDFLSVGIGPVQSELYNYIDTSSSRMYCSARWQLVSLNLK